jgi:hypothetical protein
MPLGGLIFGGVTALGSGAIGAIEAGHAQGAASDAAQSAVNSYLNILVPDPEEQKLILEKYQQTGEMDPRLEKAFQQAQTEASKITTNPQLEDAQMSALSALQDEAHNGGHTLQQDAYLNKVENNVSRENAGREGAIEGEFARRGMGGPSGLMLSAKEQNNQNMTQIENEASMNAAAQAQQQALQALQGEGQIAGNIRSQDFNEAKAVSDAQDQINRFNDQMTQGVESRNTAAKNAAQSYNLQEKQKIADQNTGLSNYEQQYNKGLNQQQFQNKMSKASGEANAYTGQANQYNQNANQEGNMWGNISQGALKAGVGVGNIYASNNKGTAAPTTSGSRSGYNQDDPFDLGSLGDGSF